MSDICQLLGVDLGGTKTAIIAGDSTGEVLGRVEFPTLPSEGYLQWLNRLKSFYRNLTSCAGDWTPQAAGISTGGPADWDNGILLGPPNLPGWDNIPIRSDIKDLTGLPCKMEHDGRAGALAEHRFGAGQGSSNMVFLTFGTGIGAGIIINGHIYRGTSGSAGEVGHVRVAPRGPLAYGKSGCLESYASGTGISKLAALRFPEKWPTEPSAKDVIEAAFDGDESALQVLDESAEKLGLGLAMLTDILNPEVIILGSLASRLPESYLQKALDVMRDETLQGNFEACRVVPSALGSRLQDLAALVAALEGV